MAVDGTHTVYATDFGQAAGMIFDVDGDMYIAEQDFDRVWRVDVPDVNVPALAVPGKLLLGLLMMTLGVRISIRPHASQDRGAHCYQEQHDQRAQRTRSRRNAGDARLDRRVLTA